MDTRNVDSKVSDVNLDNASQFLAGQLYELEDAMATAYKKKKSNDLFLLGCQYKSQLNETINKLQNVSRYCITQLSIANLHTSEDKNTISTDFQCYINFIQNMTDMIQRDILSQPLPHASVRMERWIYILKSLHERHDYFSAGVLIIALCSESIIKSKLESNLSMTAKSIIKYYEGIYSKSHVIHTMQERQHNNGEVIIPLLTSLPAMIDGVKNDSDKVYVKSKIASYISLYENMQRDHVYFRHHSDNKMKEHIKNLQLSNNESLQGINYSRAERVSHKIKKSKFNSDQFTKEMSLYDVDDNIYLHINKLSQLRASLGIYKSRKSNEMDRPVVSQIEGILKDKTLEFKDKTVKVSHILTNNYKVINNHLLSLCKEIILTLSNLQLLEQKFKLIEPHIISTKESKRIVNSESRRELSLKRNISNSKQNNDIEIVNNELNSNHSPRHLHSNRSSRILRSSRKSFNLSDPTHLTRMPGSAFITNSPRGSSTADIITTLSNTETVNNNIITHDSIPIIEKPSMQEHTNSEDNTIKKTHSNSPRKLPRKHTRHSTQIHSVTPEIPERLIDNKVNHHSIKSIVSTVNNTQPMTHTLKRSSSLITTQIEQFDNIDQPKKSFSAPLPYTNRDKQEADMLQYDVKAQITLMDQGIFSQDTARQTSDPITCDEITALKLQKHVSSASLFRTQSVRYDAKQADHAQNQILKK